MKKISVAEQRLYDYPNFAKEIAKRKLELVTTVSNFNSVLENGWTPEVQHVIKNDVYINNRLFWTGCVNEVLDSLEPCEVNLIRDRYFTNVYSVRDLAKKYHLGIGTVSRLCKRVCKMLEEKLGE